MISVKTVKEIESIADKHGYTGTAWVDFCIQIADRLGYHWYTPGGKCRCGDLDWTSSGHHWACGW